MTRWRKILTVTLAVWLPVVSLQATSLVDPAAAKELVNRLGTGANIKVKLSDGKKYRGLIQSIQEEGFELAAERDRTPRSVSYNQVAELKLADIYYKANGFPDPIEARRTVEGLGNSKHVMVKLGDGRKVHGLIKAINADHFTLQPDHQQTLLQIAYNDTWQVEPNLSRTSKIFIWAGVAVAILAVVLIGLASREGGL
jgi:ribosome maturation factor RimP